ncbi:MAG: 1-acyl-sn-glycerol-3-phosphate acyltransferase [Pseudomonadota bacterium]
MQASIEIPYWLAAVGGFAALIALLDRVLAPSIRWYLRRRLNRAVEDLNKSLQLGIQPFKLMRRQVLVNRLAHDPKVMEAAEAHIAETDMPRDLVYRQVEQYAREIAPSFSAHMYFGVGARLSRWISRTLYRVRLGRFEREALAEADPNATIIFVMNHRSNVDYLLVTYLASESSALSYAVGEWARVWPLSRLIRSMGAYFVRRRSRDALYRAVLRRYVQLSTEGGVTQAIFPEGGLSRDGALAPPKLGLLNYVVDEFEPEGERDVLFIPVGLNYDRVLEDRLLLAAADTREPEPGEPKRRFNVSLWTAARFTLGYLFGRMTGRTHRFGYACVSFGAPLSLKAFSADCGEEDPTEALGRALSRRIGEVIPVLPVSLVARELLAADGAVAEDELRRRSAALAERLAAAGAHLHLPRDDLDYGIEVGVRMLRLRRIIAPTEGGLAIAPGERELVAYYANAIAHLKAA